ncbi:hypothetical protein SteCoe_19661 [Stentor coeruleus]|uniref:Uncharacterized protein n=1 Tax=Stentor coeruleus TaxID=5963 RepID=A0A1R2BU96_9CILI|nr:hypothetical protein SteCoe_19661 [Stentor coeruleus]
MLSSISTSPTSSEDEENKFFKASSDIFDLQSKPRSSSVSSEPLTTIPEAGAEEEDFEDLLRRSGSLKRGSKSKKFSRKSVSPRGLYNNEPWASGLNLKDDYYMDRRPYKCITSLDRQVILEEDPEAGEKVASPRISLVVDKTEVVLDKKRRLMFDSSESIQEERNEEEKIQIFRHSDLYIKSCDEFTNSPRSSLISLVPTDSIKEEDEGDEEKITLKHDEFIKRIALNDEQFMPVSEMLMSSLQEVREEDEDANAKEN